MSYILHYQATLNEFNQNQTAKFQRMPKFESPFFTMTSAASPCSTLNTLEMKSK